MVFPSTGPHLHQKGWSKQRDSQVIATERALLACPWPRLVTCVFYPNDLRSGKWESVITVLEFVPF